MKRENENLQSKEYMKMGYVEWNCSKCGKKNRETCNAWVYGSPIRYCKACNQEYFDSRWREIALEGYEPATKSPKLYLFATIGFLVFTIVCSIWLFTDIRTTGSYPIKLLGCVLAGIIATIGCFVIFLRIVLGYEDKQNQKYYEESLQRMKDKSYVEKLISYGYNVPDRFR